MALNNIFLKFFILNSSYVTVNFQGVMVQLAARVAVRQNNLGIQLRTLMVYLYLCLPDRCGQKTHKSKGDRQGKIGEKENVCLFCSYVFSVRTG